MRGEQLIFPGDVVAGAYRVDHLLRAGPICTVAAARHVTERGTFALKIIDTSLGDGALERLERQLRASSLVQNDHIAAAHELGEIDDHRHYLVMEYLRGHALSDVPGDAPLLEPTRAVDLVLQACLGLAEAHGVGIVHRDLNPSHLFIAETPDGRPCVKILDFGSARFPGLLSGPSAESDRLDGAGPLGTPPFVAPEQVMSPDRADERSDIWSLGVLLYVLLTGRAPFSAESPERMRTLVLEGAPPSVHEHRGDVPAGLARVLERCLEKSPDGRYQDLSELAMCLAAFGPRRAMEAAQGVAAALVGTGIRPREALSTIPAMDPSVAQAVEADSNPFRRATRRLGEDAPDKALLDRILLERGGRLVEHIEPADTETETDANLDAQSEAALSDAAVDDSPELDAIQAHVRARRDRLGLVVLLVLVTLGALAAFALLHGGLAFASSAPPMPATAP